MKPALAIARGAQGSISTGFDPESISGLQVWLDADAITGLSDADPVVTWEDSSAANHDATQGSAGSRPTYQTNELNGLPVVRFDGSNDLMELGVIDASLPSAATLFIVATVKAADTEWTLYESSLTDAYWRFSDGNTYTAAFRADRPAFAAGIANDGSHLWTITSSASVWQMWQDGASLGTQAANYSGGTGAGHFIGAGPSNRLDGDIAEVLVYDSALSAGDRGDVEDYLQAKYGI